MKSPPASAEATDTVRDATRHRVSSLSPGVRPPRRVSQVDVAIDDFTQAQVLGRN